MKSKNVNKHFTVDSSTLAVLLGDLGLVPTVSLPESGSIILRPWDLLDLGILAKATIIIGGQNTPENFGMAATIIPPLKSKKD